MIPGVWTFALLALAAFRATRLLSWDTFPPVARLRGELLDTWITAHCSDCAAERVDHEQLSTGRWVGLELCPNCQSGSPANFREEHGRPLLAELVECPFCLGWWVGLGFYLGWLVVPTATLVLAVPLALSALVGLAAKNLDA